MRDAALSPIRRLDAPWGGGGDSEAVKAQPWAAFAADWAAQSSEARAAAFALREGTIGPAVDRCLPTHPALRTAGLRALRTHAALPDLGLLDAAPPPRDRAGLASPFEHRVALYERQTGPHGGLAWAIRELGFLAARTDSLERQGWDTPRSVDPARDLETAACWASWAAGSLWPCYGTFHRLFLPAAREAFQSVLAAHAVPAHVRDAALDELPHAFCTVMLADQHAIPGILDVALRIVERDIGGPLVALARQLPADSWAQTRACLGARGAWADTVREIGGSRFLAEDPGALDDLVTLHTTRRLLGLWAEGMTHPRTSWRVLRQNRGKVRGRLRALLAERLGREIGGVLMDRDGLYAQTRAAVAAFSLSWAWHELRAGWPMNPDNAVTPRCEPPDPALLPLDPSLEGVLRTWVLLVALRGRTEALQIWTDTGKQPEGDAAFGRLLTDALPEDLVDPGPVRRDYRRVRDALQVSLGEHLTALLPWFQLVAGLAPGRGLNRRFKEALDPIWDARVPFPLRDFPDMQVHAAALCRATGPSEEDPWSP